jgi:hypothetical protein
MSGRRYTAVALLVTAVLRFGGGCAQSNGPGFDGIRPTDEVRFAEPGGSGGTAGHGCTPPSCDLCADCYTRCTCATQEPAACVSACGGGGSGSIACKRGNEPCTSYTECCTQQCNTNGCSACAEANQACNSALPCCTGTCFNGVCQSNCKESYGSCSAGSECCSGSCTSGYCANCDQIGEPCVTDSAAFQCCPGSSCADTARYASLGTCCKDAGAACIVDADCCGSAPIAEAARACVNGACCGVDGGSCASGSECCSGQCANGRCCGSLGASCSSLPDSCCAPLLCNGTTCSN